MGYLHEKETKGQTNEKEKQTADLLVHKGLFVGPPLSYNRKTKVSIYEYFSPCNIPPAKADSRNTIVSCSVKKLHGNVIGEKKN